MVNDKYSPEDKLNGVKCSVENCEYHDKNNYCSADSIKVGAEYARKKDDTYCGTFISKESLK